MIFTPETTVGDLAARYPSTIRVFQRLGIEFCCGGKQPLVDACRDRHLSYSELANALTAAVEAAPRHTDWANRPITELTSHIVEAFHAPLRQELPRLHGLAVRLQGHGDAHWRALAVVLHELARFQAEQEVHMAAEERDLFPLVARLAEGHAAADDRTRFASLRSTLEADHADAGQTLRVLKQITDNYRAPKGACPTMRELYRGLEELEQLMRLHVHLENNVLFPRAAAQMAEAGPARFQ